MHELSVTTHLLDLALDHAGTATRITDLHLVIGQLSSIIDDSVQTYWEIISENTIAAGSKLHFRRVPAELLCEPCNLRFPFNMDDFMCPQCGNLSVKIVAGEEFYLDSIEIECAEQQPTEAKREQQ